MLRLKRMEPSCSITAELWEACRSGDKQAYASIYTTYYPRLFNYGKKFTADEQLIEDSAQEIFTSFWFNRQKLHAVKEVPAYLLVSFRNHLIRSIRAQAKGNMKNKESENDFALELSVDQVMINSERMYEQSINLRDSLDKLTAHQKEAIFLRFYENLSYEDIASVFGISVKATYKLMSRAVSELRTVYKLKLASAVFSVLSFFLPFY